LQAILQNGYRRNDGTPAGNTSDTSCTVLAVLVGLQTTPLNLSHFFIPDFTVGITIALLQTVPSLAVLTTASWLSVFDSTADCCLRWLAR
jgi:hypothetical protein